MNLSEIKARMRQRAAKKAVADAVADRRAVREMNKERARKAKMAANGVTRDGAWKPDDEPAC